MQGDSAEASIIAALCAVADRQEAFDAAVLIRGGGSRNDLRCFDAYRLCSYVAQFPLPVVTGIGHDKDTSVADLVAHTALKTPTAAAGWLVERAAAFESRLDSASLQLHDAATGLIRRHETALERLRGEIRLHAHGLLDRQRTLLQQRSAALPEAVRSFVARTAARLETARELTESRSPQRILRLGFAVVRDAGKPLLSVHDTAAGRCLDIEVADGTLTATVKEKR